MSPEAELLIRARAGDRAAARALSDAVEGRVRRFVVRHVSCPMEADDIVQDVLLALHGNLSRLGDQEQLLPFVYRVARNLCWDSLRRTSRGPLWSGGVPDLEEGPAGGRDGEPHEVVPALLVAEELRRAVDALGEPHRTTILLVGEEGLTQSQAAAALGINVGTVKSRIHYARKRLLRALRPETREALGLRASEEERDG